MTVVDHAPIVLSRTPPWVWAVLLLLIVLGVRRLKPRRTHLAVAALAPVGFTIWSLTGVLAAIQAGSPGVVIGVWATAILAGALTVLVHPGPRPVHQGGGVFLFRGSTVPLLIYLLVFAGRYGLGVWAGFQPELARPLSLAAIAISAATAGRFIADFVPLLREARRPGGFAPKAPRTT